MKNGFGINKKERFVVNKPRITLYLIEELIKNVIEKKKDCVVYIELIELKDRIVKAVVCLEEKDNYKLKNEYEEFNYMDILTKNVSKYELQDRLKTLIPYEIDFPLTTFRVGDVVDWYKYIKLEIVEVNSEYVILKSNGVTNKIGKKDFLKYFVLIRKAI